MRPREEGANATADTVSGSLETEQLSRPLDPADTADLLVRQEAFVARRHAVPQQLAGLVACLVFREALQ